MVPTEVSLHCPHCGKHTAVSPAPLFTIVRIPNAPNGIGEESIRNKVAADPYYRYANSRWWLGRCNACEQPLLVDGHGAKVYPTPQPGPVSVHIPEPMRSDLLEAKQCFAASAWNAAVVMARRALQCSTVEQGAPTDKGWPLWKQIAWLDENRKITPTQRQLADAARWVGNHGAHDSEPDVAAGQPVITNVSDEDARDTIQLVEHLFETLYVAPRMAAAQLAKRGKLDGGPQK